MSEPAAAGIGHNLPPDPHALARIRVNDLVTTANRWLHERPELVDTEMAAKADDFMNQLTAEIKAVEAQRKALLAPHEEAVKSIREAWKPLIDLLETAKGLFAPKLRAWLQKERDRKEAERKAAEAEALAKMQAAEDARRAAEEHISVEAALKARQAEEDANAAIARTAQASTRPQVKGNFAPRARTLRRTWRFRVLDAALVPREWLCIDETKIGQAIRRADDPVRTIPGIEIYAEETAA